MSSGHRQQSLLLKIYHFSCRMQKIKSKISKDIQGKDVKRKSELKERNDEAIKEIFN